MPQHVNQYGLSSHKSTNSRTVQLLTTGAAETFEKTQHESCRQIELAALRKRGLAMYASTDIRDVQATFQGAITVHCLPWNVTTRVNPPG